MATLRFRLLGSSVGCFVALIGSSAAAQQVTASPLELERLTKLVGEQSERLKADERLLDEQGRTLQAQRALLDSQQVALTKLLDNQELGVMRAAGADPGPGDTLLASDQGAKPAVVQPVVAPSAVGEKPSAEPLRQIALPEGVNVLTPKGHLVVDEAISYEQTSSDRLVFRGVEIVPGVQVGLIEADTASRNSAIATGIVRYGLLKRLEVEALLPYVYRADRVQTLAQRSQSITQSSTLRGDGIGDFEVTGRYQLTSGVGNWPILVGNLRFKSDTGRGPFDVHYDDQGVAQTLAVGSGFLGIEPSLSAIYTSDPVVFFGNVSYLNNFSRTFNKQIGNALVGNVAPGNSVGASMGFAFSVNPSFSFTIGYKHNYFYPTKTELSGVEQKSTSLQVGSLLFGWSVRLTNRFNVLSNLEVGATSDAPNVVITFRVPYVF